MAQVKAKPAPGSSAVLLSIQVIRGVATFVVVLAHVQLYVAYRLDLPDLLPFNGVVGAAVDSFFVVSGFIMVYATERLFGRPEGVRIFYLRRIARILPMYWITTTFLLVYLLLHYGSLEAASATPGYVAASYFFIPTTRVDGWGTPLHGVAWTLNYEVFFYALFGLFVLMSRRRMVLALSTLICSFIAIGLIFGPLPNPWNFWTYPLIVEFAWGMVLALAYRDGVRLQPWLVRMLIIAGFAVLGWSASQGYFFGPDSHLRVFAWGLPTFVIVAAMALTQKPIRPTLFWRFWAFIGDASYSIYLIHALTIAIPRILLARYIEPASAPWLYVVLMLILAFIPGILAYVYFEKPLLEHLQRKIEGDRRPATPLAATPPP